MRKSVKESISSTVNDLIESGLGDKIMKEEYDFINLVKNPYAQKEKVVRKLTQEEGAWQMVRPK